MDGRTTYERNEGEKATTLGLGLGEAVLCGRKKVGGALGRTTLGVMEKSGELTPGVGQGRLEDQNRPQETSE